MDVLADYLEKEKGRARHLIVRPDVEI